MIETSIALVSWLRKMEVFQKSGRVVGVSRTGFTFNKHFVKHFNDNNSQQRYCCLTKSNRKHLSTAIERLTQCRQYGSRLRKAKEDHRQFMQKFRKFFRVCKDPTFSLNFIFFFGKYHALVSYSISISISISLTTTPTKDFVASPNQIKSSCQQASQAILNGSNTEALRGR